MMVVAAVIGQMNWNSWRYNEKFCHNPSNKQLGSTYNEVQETDCVRSVIRCFSKKLETKMSQTEQTEQSVLETHCVEQNDGERNDPAFEVIEVNTATGETTVVIQKGIVGALANQLKNTSNRRKGSSILRKLGYVLADCGDVQYGGEISKTELDPSLVTDQVDE